MRHDHINMEPDELGCELDRSAKQPVGVSPFDPNVPALHKPELPHPCPERLRKWVGRRLRHEDTHEGHPPRRLRVGSERRGEEAEAPSDERSSLHH